VADPHVTFERRERRFIEDLSDEAEFLVDEDVLAVRDRDTGGFLAAVLQREEAEIG
jgi:hypothetical protein